MSHAWDEPKYSKYSNVLNFAPMFRVVKNNYGRTVNLCNDTAAAELEEYKILIGERKDFAIGDKKFFEFEIWLSEKYKENFREYVKNFGGLSIAVITLKAANLQSNLLEYWLRKKEEKYYERKNSISETGRLEESEAYSA